VAEVAAGKRAEARASWWGFDPVESTRALQAAIDSKARKVVVENMGSPWIVDEIRLRGDLEVVFEPGVVVQAKRGAFKATNASLFTATRAKNLTLRGPGATLKMWREDYDDPSRYKKAEWRHVLDFKSCADVRVIGLTLSDSGGDGVYLGVSGGGPNTNILIQDVICERNYRQGISVISARGLTIERCVLRDTAGTSPMAGIDFEPNRAGEEISDCVMRDCVSENNAGVGFAFYLRPLDAASRPVSVRLERCRSVGNRAGLAVNAAGRAGGGTVKGEIVVADCAFSKPDGAGLSVVPNPTDALAIRFERCRIVDANARRPDQAPIQLVNQAGDSAEVGNVAFDDCEVVDPVERRPIGFHDSAGGARLVGVSGVLTVEHAGRRETVKLDQALIDSWFPFQAYRRFPPYPGRKGPFAPVVAAAKDRLACDVRQRARSEWLVWAEAGDEVAMTVVVQPVGESAAVAAISRIEPSGKETKLGAVEGMRDVAFRAEESGAHRLVCDPGSATVAIARINRRVAMYAPERPTFHLLAPVGDLVFFVPAGTEAFAVRVTGEGPGELVKATLLDPAGETVEERDDIEAYQFLVERPVAPEGAVWSLRLARPSQGVLEDVHVELQGLPPVLAASPEALLKPAP